MNERFEKLSCLFFGQSDSRILHGNGNPAFVVNNFGCGANGNGSLVGKLCRIADEVGQYLPQPGVVGKDLDSRFNIDRDMRFRS